jgi:hypothetical protein
MSDQNSPYEPPTGSGSGPAGGGGTEPSSGAGYPPPNESGSIYESASHHALPPEPAPQSGAPVPPPVAGAAPPGYEGYQQPGAYAAAPPARNNTQLYGILGIVFAVVCCPLLGILFGWMSMNEAKKTGSDDTLGKVGFWLGIAFTAIGLVSAIIAICAGGISGWNNR